MINGNTTDPDPAWETLDPKQARAARRELVLGLESRRMLRPPLLVLALAFGLALPAPAALAADGPSVVAAAEKSRATKRKRPRKKRAHKKKAPPTKAEKKSQNTFQVGLEGFLVTDKVIVGPELGFRIGRFGADVEIGLGFTSSEEGEAALGGDSFFGILGGLHVVAAPVQLDLGALEIGTGIDMWWLSGIASSERKYAWPVKLALRAFVFRPLTFGITARYYILESEGLESGVAHDGSEESSFPVIFSLTAGGRW